MGYFDDNNWWNTHVKPITGPLFAPNDWLPSGGADPQDFVYLETMPGAFARRMTNTRVCDPLWPVFGCKESTDGEHTEIVPGYELPYQFQSEDDGTCDDVDCPEDLCDDGEGRRQIGDDCCACPDDSETPEDSGSSKIVGVSLLGVGLLVGYFIAR